MTSVQLLPELPLPFMNPMLRAMKKKLKTQTRRMISAKLQACLDPGDDPAEFLRQSKYQVGRRVWVRENLRLCKDCDGCKAVALYDSDRAQVWRDGELASWDWKVKVLIARYMPRWACRQHLELTEVRVQQVKDISEEDAIAEGIAELSVAYGTKARSFAFNVATQRNEYTGPERIVSAREAFFVIWNNMHHQTDGDATPPEDWAFALTFKDVTDDPRKESDGRTTDF